MSLKIETGENNQILRNISDDVKKHELKKYEKLGKEMLKYIKDTKNGGVGLAAPQVGVNKRIIAVTLMEDREDEISVSMIMINPVIFEVSDTKNTDTEGCLSVPEFRGEVERPNCIKVRFLDLKGKEQSLVLRQLAARVVSHEIDHLNGVLFIDKLEK